MSTDFYLEMETEASLDDIWKRLTLLLPKAEVVEDALYVPTMSVVVREPGELSRELAQEVWGIGPSIFVAFCMSHENLSADYEESRRALSTASADLAMHFDAGATLTHQNGPIFMLRRQGRLYFFDRWPEWTHPEVLAKIKEPFTVITGPGTPESVAQLIAAPDDTSGATDA